MCTENGQRHWIQEFGPIQYNFIGKEWVVPNRPIEFVAIASSEIEILPTY